MSRLNSFLTRTLSVEIAWIALSLAIATWPFYLLLPGLGERVFVLCFALFLVFAGRGVVDCRHELIPALMRKEYLPAYLFVIYNGFSYIVFVPDRTVSGHPDLINLFLSFLIFPILLLMSRDKKRYRICLERLIAVTVLFVTIVTAEHLFLFDSLYLSGWFTREGFSEFGYSTKNQLAFSLILVFPFVYSRFVRHKTWYHFLSLSVVVFAALYTFSRMAVFSLFGALVVFCLIPGNRKRYVYHAVAVLLILALASLLTGITPERYLELRRTGQISASSPETAEILRGGKEQWLDLNLDRMKYAQEALKGFLERPLFGHGIMSFSANHAEYRPDGSLLRRPSSHNDYLQVLYELGLIGFFPLALFLLVCFN